MLFKFLSVVVLGASSALALATPTPTSKSINPPVSAVNPRYHPISQVDARELTNAKRLALGLPLKPPVRRNNNQGGRSQPSGLPGYSNNGSPNPGSSNNNVARGYVECMDQNGNSLGYLGKDQNSAGQYGVQTDNNDESGRLLVSIDLNDASSGACDVQTLNGPDSNLPFFGGMKGYQSSSSDLSPGSSNHFFIGGTTQTSSKATPCDGTSTFEKIYSIDTQIESAIWNYDATSNFLSPQWINSDSSNPTTYIGLYQNALVCTGDQNAFSNAYGSTTWVIFGLKLAS
ncbi:hypothetical protein H0H92_002453 [Tricholoma furcatifolium]|nr:hypothetical protein H0H92_002453 [Tricholoma furcatifolium]